MKSAILSVLLFGVMNTNGWLYGSKTPSTTTTKGTYGKTSSTTTTTTKGTYGKRSSTTTTFTPDICYDLINNNPCTEENRKHGRYYFQSCSSCCNFIQCDDFGDGWDMPCAPGTSWDPLAYTCNHKNEHCKDECTKKTTQKPIKTYTQKPQQTNAPQKPQQPQKPQEPQKPQKPQEPQKPTTPKYPQEPQEPQKPQEPKIPSKYPQKTTKAPKPKDYKCYDIKSKYSNPCTKEHTSKYGFYFKSCDSCCNFIQCDDFGNSWEMPCPAGTFWDQKYHTCNHNYGQCKEECGVPKKYIQYQKPQQTQTPQKPQEPQQPQKPQEPQEPQQPQEPQKPQEPQQPKYGGNNNNNKRECYNTLDRNPCSEYNVLSNNLLWESCSGCCNFIQCDEINIGEAYDMPCGRGTYFDQNEQKCNTNYGQCNEECGVRQY